MSVPRDSERWAFPERPLAAPSGRSWTTRVRRVTTDAPTFAGEVEVVRASDYEGAAQERDELRVALRSAINGFDGWREQAEKALGWTTEPVTAIKRRKGA